MKRTDYIYLITDVSNSMQGAKIGSVNDAIHNIVHRLKKVMRGLEIEIKIVAMTFADEIKWSGILPVSLNSFVFEDFVAKAGESRMGQALMELNNKLQKQDAVLNGAEETTIILFSDGLASDDYHDSLEALIKNKVFRNSNRIVFTYENNMSDLIKEPLCVFAGKEENVIVDDFLLLNQKLFEKYRKNENQNRDEHRIDISKPDHAKSAEEYYQLACLQMKEKGIRTVDAAAFDYLKKASLGGISEAQYDLAMLYYENGTEEDYKKAFDLLSECAGKNDAGALYQLALCYRYGHGTSPNIQMAMEMLKRAANLGHKKAKEIVGS